MTVRGPLELVVVRAAHLPRRGEAQVVRPTVHLNKAPKIKQEYCTYNVLSTEKSCCVGADLLVPIRLEATQE